MRLRPDLRRRQRGGIAVPMLLVLGGLVTTLGLVEIGYLYWAKHNTQKVADLAALSGAQRLGTCAGDNGGNTAAQTNAVDDNGFSGTLEITCGLWDPAAPDDVEPETDNPHAVKVVAQLPVVPIFGFAFGDGLSVSSTAIARADQPLASFSVGSRLVDLGGGLLGGLLKSIGLDLGASLVGYDGLVDLQVTPAGLLQQLGIEVPADINVGGLNALLAAEASVRPLIDVLDATISLADPEGLLGLDAGLLHGAVTAAVGIDNLDVSLGSQSAPGGLFAQIVAPDGSADSALNVGVNALDLVYAAIGVATQNHALETGLGIPGLASVSVALVEPPSIAIGGIGATAYTGQVRIFVDVDTNGIPLVGSIASLKLPIMIDAVTGKGTITEMCIPELVDDGDDRARIAVEADILKICIGRPGSGGPFSTGGSCEDGLQDEQLIRIGLPGLNLLSLNTKLHIDALPAQGTAVLKEGESRTTPETNPLHLGTTVADLTDALLAALLVGSLGQPSLTPAEITAMANELWGTPPCNNRNCRRDRLQDVTNQINSAATGLGGFLGGLTGNVLNILDGLLTLNLVGLLNGVGGLVGGLLGTVGDLLGGILGGLLGNPCTGGGLFGGQGSDQGCIAEIGDVLRDTSGSGSSSTQNALIALVGFLLQALQPVLDSIGQLLSGILSEVLGLNLGQVDVHLESLNCNAAATLVH